MKIAVLPKYKEVMDDERSRLAWCDLLELRQRLYTQQFHQALILDKYDLIADHLLVYTDNHSLMAYARALSTHHCKQASQIFPLQTLALDLPVEHAAAIERFLSELKQFQKIAVSLSYLCMDEAYRSELKGVKLADLLIWISLQRSGSAPGELSYCATPNAKYHLTSWLEKLGPKNANLSLFNHPVVPEPHDLVLIPVISQVYWENRQLIYQNFSQNLEIIGAAKLKIKKTA